MPRLLYRDASWRTRVEDAIRATEGTARKLAELLAEGRDVIFSTDPSQLVQDLDKGSVVERVGLAHALAESGLLPMYGMPTRVRQLYIGLRREGGQQKWSSVDRDLDLAVYEFAPGSSIVLDKREHIAVGFTPELSNPLKRRGDSMVVPMQSSAFGQSFSLVQCGLCQAWTDVAGGEVVEKCACGAALDPLNRRLCRVPHAFRTDLPVRARQSEEEGDGGTRPPVYGVVARILTGPHDAHRQDPHRPMRYDTGRPRAVIRLRISQPRTTSLPCPAGLRARRPSPMMDL